VAANALVRQLHFCEREASPPAMINSATVRLVDHCARYRWTITSAGTLLMLAAVALDAAKFFPRAQDESRVPDAVQRSPSDAKHHLVRCSAGPGHMGPDQPNEQTKRRALRKPSLVCADLLAQGKRATSPPLPARRPNLFDAACVTTSPAVEKTGERRSARTLAALWRSPSA
jgi:hypothetical protein